jgi:hypothetical protein
MVLNVVRSIFEASISFGHISDKQVLYDTFRVFVEVFGELNLALKNLLINGHGVVVVKRIDPS